MQAVSITQAVEELKGMRDTLKRVSFITLIFFTGMLLCMFIQPPAALALGAANAAFYIFLLRPTLKRYNETYIAHNAVYGLGTDLSHPVYTARPDEHAEYFVRSAFFPSAFDSLAPSILREIKGRSRDEGFDISIYQLLLKYRRQGQGVRKFFYGSLIKISLSTHCADFLLTTKGMPDTRFTQSDYERDGWIPCPIQTEALSSKAYLFSKERDFILPPACEQHFEALLNTGNGHAAIGGSEGTISIFIPGRFYGIPLPISVKAEKSHMKINRLPELSPAIDFCASLHEKPCEEVAR